MVTHQKSEGQQSLVLCTKPVSNCGFYKKKVAGGESAEAVFNVVERLKNCAENPVLLESKYDSDLRVFREFIQLGRVPQRPLIKFNHPWVVRMAKSLSSEYQRVYDLRNRSTQGIIFAVKLDKGDLSCASFDIGHGLSIRTEIPPIRIVGKLIIENPEILTVDAVDCFTNRWMFEWIIGGKLGRRDPIEAKIENQQNPLRGLSPLEFQVLRDFWASVISDYGHDLSAQIVRECGSSAVQAFFAQNSSVSVLSRFEGFVSAFRAQ